MECLVRRTVDEADRVGVGFGGRRPGVAVGDAGAGTAAPAQHQLEPQSLLLLPLLLLPAQLLAPAEPALAGADRRALHAAARLHGLPRLPGAPLALRTVEADAALPRLPLLARP